MGFDLSALDTSATSDTGAKMVVLHPATGVALNADDGEEVFIVLAGEDSERCKAARRAISNKRLKAQSSGLRVQVTREEIEADDLDVLVSCTMGWGGLALDGKDLEFSPANARVLYTKLPWLREQANAFITDRANFLKPSPKG
jgi:hypothetical protein